MNTITLSEALGLIHSGARLDLEVVRFDKKRNKGGNIDTILDCRKVNEHLVAIEMHKRNFTFDFRVYVEGQPTGIIERVHALLILSINGRDLLL